MCKMNFLHEVYAPLYFRKVPDVFYAPPGITLLTEVIVVFAV